MDYISHYGILRKSGRYPWGSGEEPYQSSDPLVKRVKELKRLGISETERASILGFKNTADLRAGLHLEKESKYQAEYDKAYKLQQKGYSDKAIAETMGITVASVTRILSPITKSRHEATANTKNALIDEIAKKGMIDVGSGSEVGLGVSRVTFKQTMAELERNGYVTTDIQVDQLGTNNKTRIKVMLSPDEVKKALAEYPYPDSEKFKNKSEEEKIATAVYIYASKHNADIGVINKWSTDYGATFNAVSPPVSISSDRIKVRFANTVDNGVSGSDMDGVIQLRRGVSDLSIGDNHYAQVRIAVDGTHYLKGMAIYSDDMPKGIDVIYNSAKNEDVGKMGAMKKINVLVSKEDGIYMDKDGNQKINEFGASVRQTKYVDKDGVEKQSAINFVGFQGKEDSGVEGSWSTWSKNLSSQFLSKQPVELAKQQLKLAYDDAKEEYDSIMKLTNPVVKQTLLDSLADKCDSDAVHLKAAAMPRQTSNVILPIPSLKENQCYAEQYRNGEQIALIRYPHAGVFEIPVLTVNNRNKEGKSVLGGKNGNSGAMDAIGIHPKTAAQLSGADFDGDTVIAIPYNSKLKTSAPLKDLQDFNPKEAYPKVPGMKVISSTAKQKEMGKISNLITDMTILNAPPSEIARAVKHSMVVIDAEKHELNYKKSYLDNGIAALKETYQGGRNRGASTLISRAASEERVDKRKAATVEEMKEMGIVGVRKQGYGVDIATGGKVFTSANESYVDGKGNTVMKQVKSTKMYETGDAKTLIPTNRKPTLMETTYANHANSLKALGDKCRKSSVTMEKMTYSPEARKVYAGEVASLNNKVKLSASNAPLERAAMRYGNDLISKRVASNPNISGDQLKKLKGQSLSIARTAVGANKTKISITKNEWKAIEAGAISSNFLKTILSNTDLDVVRSYAAPKQTTSLSTSQVTKAKRYANNGYTLSEIADVLGVSASTISKVVNE